jgi:hypothetical protein
MDEIKLVVPTVVKACYSPRGQEFSSFSIEQPLAPGQDAMALVCSLYNELKLKVNSMIPQEAPKPSTDEKCKFCGAAMKISAKSGKPYCSALCWQKK